MNLNRQRIYLAIASVLFSAGFIVWPGCIGVPLPSSRTDPGPVQMKDVKSTAQAGLSKSEVFARLGKPYAWYGDLRVACYKLNGLEKTHMALVFGIPLFDHEKEAGIEVAMIQFDARGAQLRQTRKRILAIVVENVLRYEAEQWVSDKKTPTR